MSRRNRGGGGRGRSNARRERTRRSRDRRHGRGTENRTRVCPDCRDQIPYLDPYQDEPDECPTCGYRWDCPKCGQEIADEDRDAEGRPPATCPTCDGAIPDGVETTGEDEEFEWS